MKNRIVIVGNSLTSFLVAKKLNDTIGGLVQTEVTYFTNDANLVHLPNLKTILGKKNWIAKKPLLSHIDMVVGDVKSINLKQQKIIAEKSVEFDEIFIDLTRTFTEAKLTTISKIFQREVSLSESRQKSVTELRCGIDIWSKQLGLALGGDLTKLPIKQSGHIKIVMDEVEPVKFLESQKIVVRHQKKVGEVTLHAPVAIIEAADIRGAKLDKNKQPIIDLNWRASYECGIVLLDQYGDKISTNYLYANSAAAKIVRMFVNNAQILLKEPSEYMLYGTSAYNSRSILLGEPLRLFDNWLVGRFSKATD